MKKLKFLIILLAASLIFAFAGCATNNGIPSSFSVSVTYCFNGGSISEYSGLTELKLYYREGSVIAEPGKSTAELPAPKRNGYSIGGWYYAEMKDGEVVRDESGTPVPSDRLFDFKSDRAEGNIWLVAVWLGKIRVTFVNVYQTNRTEYYTKDYESGQTFNKPALTNSWVNGKNVKIDSYYWSYNEETKEFSDPIEFGSLTFDDLNAHLPEEPEMQGEFIMLQVYAKLAEV